MYGALKSSITIWTPSWSMVMSSGRRMSSKAMPYCMPEQPPPLTKIRSASCGFPSLERSSLRRVWASEVSETTACSITFWMLPRPSPSYSKPRTSRARSAALLLERPHDVFPADHRLGHLVVEGKDHPAGDDVEHIGEDVQQLADVLQRRQLRRDDDEYALRVVEHADDDVGERDAQVEDDVAEGVDEDPHRPVDQVDGDEVSLLRSQHAGQQHHAAGVVEDRSQYRFLEVGRGHLAGRSQAPRWGEVRNEGSVVIRQSQVDEQDLSREPLAERRGEVDGHGRSAGSALGRVDGHRRRRLLGGDHARPGDQVGQGVFPLLDELGQLDDGVGVWWKRLVQRLAVEGEQLAVLERPHACRPRLFGDERHLAEEVVWAHQGDRDRVSRRLLDIHLAAPGLDHEHRVPRIALVDDDRPLGRRGGSQPAGEGVKDVVWQGEEDRYAFEDLEPLPKLVGLSAAHLVVAHASGIIEVVF